ncbi:hypothetical protein Asp14428_63460 [Actinoplanes sp. NBRC 14428]|nr:hypothetical protein Asp14428_63460 [Actinoplanes sp. NBRC 14428]
MQREDRHPGGHDGLVDGVGGGAGLPALDRGRRAVGQLGGDGAAGAALGGELAPRRRGGGARVERLAGGHGEQVGPGSRDHLDQRVPAAAGRDPAALAQLVGQGAQSDICRTLPVDGQAQVGERVEPVGVGAALGEQQLRLERADHRRHDRVEGAQPAGVARARWQRDVHRRTLGSRSAGLARIARAGEQSQGRLVQADGEHPGSS